MSSTENPYATPSTQDLNNTGQMLPCKGCSKELHVTAGICPSCGATQRSRSYKSKTVAALLAFFLGGLGVHRFYLGKWWGIFYLLLFWTYIPGLIALIECIVFLASNNEKWDQKHNEGRAAAPNEGGKGVVVIFILIGVMMMIAIIGILAAIALPAYQDYTLRAKVSQALNESNEVKNSINEYIENKQHFPQSNRQLDLDTPYYLSGGHEILIQDNKVILQLTDTSSMIDEKTIILSPSIKKQTIEWSCTEGSLERKYRPTICRGN